MEIGSEFWLDNVLIEQKSDAQWLRKFGNTVLTSSGRGAISLLLQEVNLKSKTVLLPSYICDSVIVPFINKGYHCYFYDINRELFPVIETIKKVKGIGIFLHMGYFGFSTNYNLLDIIRELKKKSTIIVEDITHTLFSDFERFEENDYYVASIRKWMALPSGGLLAAPKREIKSSILENNSFSSLRKEALLLKANYISRQDEKLKAGYLDLLSRGERILFEDPYPYQIDSLSRNLIHAADINELRKRRKDNFRTLMEGIKDIEFIKPIFKNVPENTCPMFFPVFIKDIRNNIRERLSNQQIYCPIHWSKPKEIPIMKFKNADDIYNRILSIPCDQRYEAKDMDRVIGAIRGLGRGL